MPTIKGSKFSEEHKRKISESLKGKKNHFFGRKHSEETKKKMRKAKQKYHGDKHPRYGKKHSEETKIKIGQAHKGKIISKETKEKMSLSLMGTNNPAWKGGISCDPYCEQWSDQEYKESIKERDGYVCLNPECNKTSNNLCIHHIDYDKKNCHPLNLITICLSCNSKANKNRRWHKSWYSVILYRRYCG